MWSQVAADAITSSSPTCAAGLFDYREDIFEECVRRYGLAERLIRRWMAFQELFRREIVKSSQRGLIMDGVEHKKEGFSLETLAMATLCDGCSSEVDVGATVRMHRRTGQIFCSDCGARDAAEALGVPG